MTEILAKETLEDPIIFGNLLLSLGEVDGLVGGAITSTANVISPAFKLIGTDKNTKLVSSVFFMCMPDEVLIYGDCAININPDSEELSDIAIQSKKTAEKFGIDPKIAMISYSTGNSGKGEDVEKVKNAVKILRDNGETLVDGPLQYDAAINKNVAKIKAPNSEIAGNATVFIFPDLNTGNTTYKAVQRSADVLTIGPILQGLKKPVNDLSRGAEVEDIIYTMIITNIQSQN